jgi:hypothetical protein
MVLFVLFKFVLFCMLVCLFYLISFRHSFCKNGSSQGGFILILNFLILIWSINIARFVHILKTMLPSSVCILSLSVRHHEM